MTIIHLPIGFGPLGHEFSNPESPGHHPAKASEKVCPVEKVWSGLVNLSLLAIVVPSTDTPQSWVFLEDGVGCLEILKEVRRDLEVVLHNDHLLVLELVNEGLVQGPPVVSGDLEVAFLSFGYHRFTLVRLLQEYHLVAVATNHIGRLDMIAVLLTRRQLTEY